MTTLTVAVRGEIRAEMARKGIGQKVLAGVWGISQSAVAHKLAGRSRITDREIDSAAALLGYDPFDFVARAGANASAA